MKKLNNFLAFNASSFLKGKEFNYKSGRVVNTDNFKGVTITLMCTRDDTVYPDGQAKHNIYNEMVIKVPNVDESYLKQFTVQMPLRVTVTDAKPYVRKEGNYAMIDVSFTGNVEPLHKG